METRSRTIRNNQLNSNLLLIQNQSYNFSSDDDDDEDDFDNDDDNIDNEMSSNSDQECDINTNRSSTTSTRLYSSTSSRRKNKSKSKAANIDKYTKINEINSDGDEDKNINKKQNILFKLINRERTGFFSNSTLIKSNQNAFKKVPNRLSFCLKEIVPYCYLKNHVFMGLTACGQFLLSYTMRQCEEEPGSRSNNIFATYFKYELYFWIYRPHNLLMKFYNVCLFDDHGVDSIKTVTMAQWKSKPRTLIIHGAGDYENEDSFITIISVPKLGCLDCKELRDEYYSEPTTEYNRSAALCINCNLAIHTKYSRTESDPKFDPYVNLNCPECILIVTNGLIHMLQIKLELNKPLKIRSNSINISYINNGTNNYNNSNNKNENKYDIEGQEMDYAEESNGCYKIKTVVKSTNFDMINKNDNIINIENLNGLNKKINYVNHGESNSNCSSSSSSSSSYTSNSVDSRNVISNSTRCNISSVADTSNNSKYFTNCSKSNLINNISNSITTITNNSNINNKIDSNQHGCDLLCNINNTTNGNINKNIVARIIADFTEYELDYHPPSREKNHKNIIDELEISCSSNSSSNYKHTNYNYTKFNNTKDLSTKNQNFKTDTVISKTIPSISNFVTTIATTSTSVVTTPPSSSSSSKENRVRLFNYRNNSFGKRNLNNNNNGITTIDLQSSTSSYLLPSGSTNNSTTTINNKILDKAAKAYEFSEDNEKCEKIGIFRKRRLADKKYEFSEDNSENIIPFSKLRSITRPYSLRSTKFNNTRLTTSSTAGGGSSVVGSSGGGIGVGGSGGNSSINLTTSSTSAAMSPNYSTNSNVTSFCSRSPTNFELTSHTHRASPNHGFRSPCGSPVGYRFMKSPPGRHSYLPFSGLSPRQLSKRDTNNAATGGTVYVLPFISPRSDDYELPTSVKPQSSLLTSSVQPLTEVKTTNIITTNDIISAVDHEKPADDKDNKPVCSKMLIRRYVEEDDATSVITSEEDDCISPGFHTSLPVEVHGACYSNMQMISNNSYQKLKCPAVILTQNTFDMETFSYHVTNYLCSLNNMKYIFFFDWSCEIVNVCPISSILTCILMVHFTARELQPPNIKQCINCLNSQNFDCVFHRKHFECCTLFTWNINSNDWTVLDYGNLTEVSPIEAYKRIPGELSIVVKKYANELLSSSILASTTDENLNTNNNNHHNNNLFNNLRILTASNDKSMEFLRDDSNSIEFYRSNKSKSSHNFSLYSDDSSDFD